MSLFGTNVVSNISTKISTIYIKCSICTFLVQIKCMFNACNYFIFVIFYNESRMYVLYLNQYFIISEIPEKIFSKGLFLYGEGARCQVPLQSSKIILVHPKSELVIVHYKLFIILAYALLFLILLSLFILLLFLYWFCTFVQDFLFCMAPSLYN